MTDALRISFETLEDDVERWLRASKKQPVIITREGVDDLVLLSAHEFRRLTRLDSGTHMTDELGTKEASVPPTKLMEHAQFKTGETFWCGGRPWRCTDIGARVITAICLEHDDDPTWYNGPPYAVAEVVFDEHDIEGCAPTESGWKELFGEPIGTAGET